MTYSGTNQKVRIGDVVMLNTRTAQILGSTTAHINAIGRTTIEVVAFPNESMWVNVDSLTFVRTSNAKE